MAHLPRSEIVALSSRLASFQDTVSVFNEAADGFCSLVQRFYDAKAKVDEAHRLYEEKSHELEDIAWYQFHKRKQIRLSIRSAYRQSHEEYRNMMRLLSLLERKKTEMDIAVAFSKHAN